MMAAAGWVNAAEALLWLVVAVIVGWHWRAGLLVLALVVFAISDVIEITTGAWYRPWWLLVVKIACVAVIGWRGWRLIRDTRERRPA
jgi:hypothetical protein